MAINEQCRGSGRPSAAIYKAGWDFARNVKEAYCPWCQKVVQRTNRGVAVGHAK